MCHSAIEEMCMGTESIVWIDKMHEQIKNQGFIFTETDTVYFLVLILQVLLYILDLISCKKLYVKYAWFGFFLVTLFFSMVCLLGRYGR